MTELGDRHPPVSVIAMGEIRTEVQEVVKLRPESSGRPLVPKPTEVLAELEVILRQSHQVDLGDWRAAPSSAPVPRATLERLPKRSE